MPVGDMFVKVRNCEQMILAKMRKHYYRAIEGLSPEVTHVAIM